jgi:hypothetical protein
MGSFFFEAARLATRSRMSQIGRFEPTDPRQANGWNRRILLKKSAMGGF